MSKKPIFYEVDRAKPPEGLVEIYSSYKICQRVLGEEKAKELLDMLYTVGSLMLEEAGYPKIQMLPD